MKTRKHPGPEYPFTLQKKLFTVKQAALYLDVTVGYLYKLTSRRIIPHFKPNGKRIYFLEKDLLDFLLRNRINSVHHDRIATKSEKSQIFSSDQQEADISTVRISESALFYAEVLRKSPPLVRYVSRDGHPLTEWLSESLFNWHIVNVEMTNSEIAQRVTQVLIELGNQE